MSLSIKIITIFGIMCLAYSALLVWERNNPARLSFTSYSNSAVPQRQSSVPHILKVPSIQVELPIIPASISNNKWSTTKKGISYLSSSPVPGNKGNSILYGHNYPHLLGRLAKTQVGQTIEITYTNGKRQSFYISGMAVVTPDQTHILQNSTDTRITLYTCAGFLDSKRLVVTAVAKEKPQSTLNIN